jgi:hypothetical protein
MLWSRSKTARCTHQLSCFFFGPLFSFDSYCQSRIPATVKGIGNVTSRSVVAKDAQPPPLQHGLHLEIRKQK